MASIIPSNQARFTRQELLEATGGAGVPFDGAVAGVFTDSRAAIAGGLFVALRGESFDGHQFAAAAAAAGARILLVEEPQPDCGAAVQLRVTSTWRALGDLARYHRRRWSGRVLAVAGSVGKTTTRTALASVAAATGKVTHCPPGNLNNLIGVPMVLLGLSETHELGIVELGTNLPGEIERLTDIAAPDVAVLTRIALEHSEGLGDLDGIEWEEGALLRGLRPEAVAIVNGDDERCVRQLANCSARRQVLYGLGAPGARYDYRILACESLPQSGTALRIQRPGAAELRLESPLLGLPGAYAFTAAVASLEALLGRPLTLEEAVTALASPLLGEPGRLEPLELSDGTLVLNDTYNSSPASVQSSLGAAREVCERRGARLVLVLGEMRELGALSVAAHRALGRDIVSSRPALVVAFGGDARHFLDDVREEGLETHFAADAAGALEIVRAERRAGDVILVKASRSLRAERVVEGLRAGESEAQ
jgi:UDP-N-acetylmuramoyl-tripeptide--D-alanyl-D-alanine ligase